MKKIMFSDKFGLTQAVLDGRKTQTRRVIPQSVVDKYEAMFDPTLIDAARYDVGEVVAVAQSYKDLGYNPISLDISPKDYRISRGTLGESKGWNNKMFVRADACKHQIRITNVRVERLQDISNEDCLAEGIEKMLVGCEYYKYSFWNIDKWSDFNLPQQAFARLINKVSKKDVWNENPYVFVYDFELLK